MKVNIKSISSFTFWLSFLSGIPILFGLVPFQSLNISIIPAGILLLKSNKVFPKDCVIALCLLLSYFLTWLFFSDLYTFKTLFEFSTVILTFVALRSSKFFPSGKGIIIYLVASIIIGLLQLTYLDFGFGGTRGIPLLASEPSRYARFFAVLILPIFIHWNYLKSKIGITFLILIFSYIIILNRSASLIVPFLVIAIAIILLSINYLKRFFKTLKINKYLLIFYTSTSLVLTLCISYFANNYRITSFLMSLIKSIFINGNLIGFLKYFGGKRISTVFYSFGNGIKTIIPNGIDSAKDILNYENLTNSFIGLSSYHTRRLDIQGTFESASFFSHYVLDAGLIAFLLSIYFTFEILKLMKQSYWGLIFKQETLLPIKIESALRISTSFMGLILLWFYSTNSFIQPWLMIAIGLMPCYKNLNKK